MGKTKAKSKKAKITQKAKTASKSRDKAPKRSKAAAKKGSAPKRKSGAAAKAQPPVSAKNKIPQKQSPIPAKPKADSKKSKVAKKDTKNRNEELELFDDEDISESEELLEYQEDLELSEAEDESEEPQDDADDSDDSDAVEADGLVATSPSEEDEDFYLTDAEGNRYCRAKDCDQIAIVDGYCRYHYLMYWKRIQIRKEILQDGKLEKYVEDLTSRYPDKFLEMLRKDLRSTKDFMAAIAELEIDESSGENEFEEDTQTYIDEVRGISDAASSSLEDDEF